ncbi:unnamed protein product [Musa acuminata subsp. malaccensis]|uniref:(wild Malaysian banana) hypothetical protein n=1 Tax=Musa acuminata subsp. malaccensis TaxID=214687 RepID=A0A804IQL3_MUSAM|nr:unnamed protein product [Musa acuminata subsp. malaccensis]
MHRKGSSAPKILFISSLDLERESVVFLIFDVRERERERERDSAIGLKTEPAAILDHGAEQIKQDL